MSARQNEALQRLVRLLGRGEENWPLFATRHHELGTREATGRVGVLVDGQRSAVRLNERHPVEKQDRKDHPDAEAQPRIGGKFVARPHRQLQQRLHSTGPIRMLNSTRPCRRDGPGATPVKSGCASSCRT